MTKKIVGLLLILLLLYLSITYILDSPKSKDDNVQPFHNQPYE